MVNDPTIYIHETLGEILKINIFVRNLLKIISLHSI